MTQDAGKPFGDLITIENICEACEYPHKPCNQPCKRWYRLFEKTNGTQAGKSPTEQAEAKK